jgi:hypothetical protein
VASSGFTLLVFHHPHTNNIFLPREEKKPFSSYNVPGGISTFPPLGETDYTGIQNNMASSVTPGAKIHRRDWGCSLGSTFVPWETGGVIHGNCPSHTTIYTKLNSSIFKNTQIEIY